MANVRVTVLFDGGCPMCRKTVRRLHRVDWLGRLQFADASNSEVRKRIAPGLSEADALLEMYAVDSAGRRFAGYDGFLRIAREVPLMWPFLIVGGLPGVRQIGRGIYRRVAASRTRRGRCTDEFCITH